MVWYSHFFQNFPVSCDPHKGFGIVNKAEIDVFLELSCFFDNQTQKFVSDYYVYPLGRNWRVPLLLYCCFLTSFLLKYFFLIIFGYAGSSLLCRLFSSFGSQRLLTGCCVQASYCSGFSLQSTAHRLQ